jgi:hypothetical protein
MPALLERRNKTFGRYEGVLVKLAFVLLLGTVAPQAYAVPFVDQQNVPPTPNGAANVGVANAVDVAQTFTVGISGRLTGFDLWVERTINVTHPLLYDFRLTEAGVPTEPDTGDNILASGILDAGLFEVGVFSGFTVKPPDDLLHVNLETPFEVQVGDVLALALRSDDPEAGCYIWHISGDNPYAPGRTYSRIHPKWLPLDLGNFDLDAVFRTYVVPQPSSAYLFGIALFVAMSWPRRGHCF